MSITHELLLSNGFYELPNPPQCYGYKGVTGRLHDGLFFFHGLSAPMASIQDLRYMKMIIDYNYESTMTPYPSNLN